MAPQQGFFRRNRGRVSSNVRTILQTILMSFKSKQSRTKAMPPENRDRPPLLKKILRSAISKISGFTATVDSLVQALRKGKARADVIEKEALKPDDYIIAVMGPTGAGKSTFISAAAGRDHGVGHGLQSVTNQVSAVRISLPGGGNVALVDTPGFDSTYSSDLEVLKLISNWLRDGYKHGVKLSGILYLHRISDNRMGSTPLKNLDMFKELCGEDGLRKVVLVTTMWQDVDGELGRDRQTELQRDYWADMVKRGSKIRSFDGSRESALGILKPLFEHELGKRPIRIQQELVDLEQDLPDTAAGQQLYGNTEGLVEGQRNIAKLIGGELRDPMDPAGMQLPLAEPNEIQRDKEKAMADMRN